MVLVKSSWAKVEPIAATAAELFYGRLFELDPSLKSLFTGNMQQQGAKLMKMIATAIYALDKIETVIPMIQESGRRHVGYGVKDEHYDTVGAALLWTLEQGLGDEFTPKVKEAWIAVYGVLASTMKDAAREISGSSQPVPLSPTSAWPDFSAWPNNPLSGGIALLDVWNGLMRKFGWWRSSK